VLGCPARFQFVIEANWQQSPLVVLSKIGPVHGATERYSPFGPDKSCERVLSDTGNPPKAKSREEEVAEFGNADQSSCNQRITGRRVPSLDRLSLEICRDLTIVLVEMFWFGRAMVLKFEEAKCIESRSLY
jgi:hypothetical protein